MKRIFVVLLGLAAIVAFVTTTDANVMVYGLRVEPSTKSMKAADFYYMLNEDADNGVTVNIYDSGDNLVRTITGAPNKRGPNAVLWDGKDDAGINVPPGDYYFVVNASDDGHFDWDMISDDGPYYIAYAPLGIDVNENPESPYYGWVYVNNSYPGTSGNPGGWEQGNDIYAFWPHGTLITYFDGSDIFYEGSSASPWKIALGPDEHLYIGDWKDGYEAAWELGPDLSSSSLVCLLERYDDDPNTDPDTATTNHGNIASLAVMGTGANRVLYTCDEDLFDYDIWRYEIGNGPFPYTGGEIWFESDVECMGDTFADFWDLVFSSDGTKMYTVDDEGPGDAFVPTPPPALAVWDITGAIPTCIGLVPTDTYPADVFCRTYSVDLDETRNRIAIGGRYNGLVFILDLTTLAITDTFPNPGASSNSRDCAFDAVGNVYVINSSIEYWRVFSPPDGPNSTSTKSPFTFKIGGLGVDEYANVPNAITVKNAPNPFSSETEIVYGIPSRADCSIKVYDVSGKLVRNLVDGTFEPGSYRVSWDGKDDAGMRLASGVYFYRVSTGNSTITKEVILVR